MKSGSIRVIKYLKALSGEMSVEHKCVFYLQQRAGLSGTFVMGAQIYSVPLSNETQLGGGLTLTCVV